MIINLDGDSSTWTRDFTCKQTFTVALDTKDSITLDESERESEFFPYSLSLLIVNIKLDFHFHSTCKRTLTNSLKITKIHLK